MQSHTRQVNLTPFLPPFLDLCSVPQHLTVCRLSKQQVVSGANKRDQRRNPLSEVKFCLSGCAGRDRLGHRHFVHFFNNNRCFAVFQEVQSVREPAGVVKFEELGIQLP